ncbi:hypothetical protein G4B88_017917 [Cannabis sativa]|uniref:Protein kinase domain-containing protein n=2 Tax=Cannabis sativa TaxID=3483 RepID=A0A7J6HIF5_CANSA|nr:hypothetical protein G4B88_017917 [Cannabis sativa]
MPHHHHGTLLCSVVVFSLHSYARHNTTTSFSLLLPVAVIFIVASASDITAFDSLLLFFNSTPHFLSSHISIPSFLCRFPPLLYVFRLYLFNINTTITNSNDVPQMLPLPILDFKDFQDNLVTRFRPWQRSFQFWIRAVDIYTGYKVRVSLVKDARKQHEMWERQHEFAAEKIYSMCADLGGFFLKVAQIVGKPDLAPAAWVRRLVTLCDQAPATSFDVVRHELEKEFGRNVWDLFETFDEYPLGSASIAQVHRARLKGDKSDVVVKVRRAGLVQHPGVQDLMMTDIHNLQAFALYMQKTDIKFDLFSVTKEMEKQIGYEFDFVREANAMEKIGRFLRESNKKTPVVVPRVVKDMVTRTVLVMEYIDGVPILNLGDEIAKRGINPDGNVAAAAKQKILKSLTLAYGQMILKSGFFHADPHPGNILICKDYGQVKDLPDALRFGYANLVLAIADNDPKRAAESYRELGIGTLSKCENEQQEMFRLAETMFDTKLPPGVTMLQPFSEDSSIKKIAVQSFPEELFSVLRTVHLLRGLSVGLGINYSCAEQWRPIAEEALYQAGRLKAEDIERRSRRRASFSSSSLESFDLDRPKSKIIKEDSLSVYEATLVKLKLGSQRNLSSLPKNESDVDGGLGSCSNSLEPMKIDLKSPSASGSEFTSSLNELEEVVTMDTDYLSQSDSVKNSKHKEESIASIFYLFSKFKNAKKAVIISPEDSLAVENGYGASIPPSFTTSQSLDVDTTVQQSENEFVPSLAV